MGMTRECVSYGVESDKPQWVPEHFCPAWGFEMDRDANAAIDILSRGFEKRELGQSEVIMAMKTALPLLASSGASDVVDRIRVRERASHGLSDAV